MKSDPYSFDRLQDIAEPARVAWWPPAPFWWFAIILIVVWCVYLIVRVAYRWSRRAYRRKALRELREIEKQHRSGDNAAGDLVKVSALLKRVALVAFPRDRVASLWGDEWLSFLSETCDQVDFSKDPLRTLAWSSIERSAPVSNENEWQQVISAARTWIDHHQAEAIG